MIDKWIDNDVCLCQKKKVKREKESEMCLPFSESLLKMSCTCTQTRGVYDTHAHTNTGAHMEAIYFPELYKYGNACVGYSLYAVQ